MNQQNFIRNNAKKILSFLLFILSIGGLAACSINTENDTEVTREKSVHFLYNFTTNSLDPHADSSYVPLRAGITETLVKLDDDQLTIEPWLAESWEGEDGVNWTVHIREGITFQNGKALDAKAVKESLERTITENIAMANTLKIESMTANDQQLNIQLKEPLAEFISELVHPNTAIIDVEVRDNINKPIGTGPFALVSFTPSEKLELERYPSYWEGPAKLDKVTFSFNEDANARTMALQAGEVDIVYRPEVESLDLLKKTEGIAVESTETFRVQQMTMNLERESLQDVHVRLAVDALIDRQSIVDNILLGYATPTVGPFSSVLPFAPDYEERPTGADAALTYLEKAGYSLVNGVMQKDNKPLEFTLLTYTSRPDLPLIAQVFQSDAKKIGIHVKIQQIDVPEEYMVSNRDWDLATYSNLTAPRGDAGYYLNATYHPEGSLNFSGVNNEKLTAIIDQLNQTVNSEERAALAEDAALYVYDQVINSFVLHPETIVAYNENKVINWKTSRSEYYMITNQLDVK